MTLTQHEQTEFARCAQAMYRRGQNATGHMLSAVAACREVSTLRYEVAATTYRAWLVFDEPKAS